MNKNMKTIFLFSALLILLVGISCATAADITDDSQTDTVQKVSTSEPASTDTAVNKVSDSKTITKTTNSTKATDTKTATDYTITESTYSNYFTDKSVAKSSAIANDSKIILSGDFKNKDFIFDNIKVTVNGNGTLYNTTITSQNGAKITVDGIKIDNENKNAPAVLFESARNTIKNSVVNIVDDKPLHGIEITGNNNIVSKVTANVKAPSADVEYDANFVGHPQTSAVLIASNNNVIKDSKFNFDGSEKTGYYPSADGIDIQSPAADVVIKNNVLRNVVVTTKGPSYVYGVNVGRAKNTTIDNINVTVDSDYYSNGIQLFDADGIEISGTINANAASDTYGVYSTAMGVGSSKDITLKKLNINTDAPKSTGALLEGSSNILITESVYNIYGDTATAVSAYVDWMGNVPKNINITDNAFIIKGTADNSVLYFGLCDNVDITFNDIISTKGSEINFNNTSKGKVTNNVISISETILGDAGVITTENDTIVKDNSGLIILTNENYEKYFNKDSTLKSTIPNGTQLIAKGNFYNKDFIFDNVSITFASEGVSTFYNATFASQNKAALYLSNIAIDNTNKNTYALLLESDFNILYKVTVKVVDNKPLHAIEITGNDNNINNLTANVKAPSADVDYDANFVGHPQSSAVLIASNNNQIVDSQISFDGSKKTGYYPSADGIDIQSPGADVVIKNNVLRNVVVTAKGPSYVYGINVGRAKNTNLDNVNVTVNSNYYSNGIQLFDANGINITGTINANAKSETYGVYSTAMGVGSSKNINLTGLNIAAKSVKATGVLAEGSSKVVVANSSYNITGDTATAVSAYVDWMGNVPKNIQVTGNNFTIKGTGNNSVLYFGLCNNVAVTNNTITSAKGSEINFNSTTKGKVTDNYITIGSKIFGDNGVITTEKDTIVKNNLPHTTIVKFNKIANVAYGNNVKISGKLVDNTGKTLGNTALTLKLNGKSVSIKTGKGGAFNYTAKVTKVGKNNVTVSYKGNTNYSKVTNKTTFKVVKQNLTVTINKIAKVVYDNKVTIKGTFADANGRGIANTVLKVKVNNKTVSVKTGKGGAFTYTTKATKVGTNYVTVSYKGNSNYNKVSQKATFKVVKQNLKIKVDKIQTVSYKDKVTITGELTDANGKIIKNTVLNIKVNSKKYTAKTNSKGVFTLSTKATATGTNNVTVSYKGNTNYNKASTKTTFKVTKKDVITTITSVKVANKKVTVTGKFTDSDKKVLMNSNVKVTINGKSAIAKTNSKGVFTYTKSVSAGTTKITASYDGNNNYKADSGSTLTINVA